METFELTLGILLLLGSLALRLYWWWLYPWGFPLFQAPIATLVMALTIGASFIAGVYLIGTSLTHSSTGP